MLMSSNSIRNQSGRSNSISQVSFKCGVGCLYLPGFSKRKSMTQLSTERSEQKLSRERSNQEAQESTAVSSETEVSRANESTVASDDQIEASRALSFERFDCTSNASGIIYNLAPEEAGWRSPYYDLPVEFIRTVSNEAEAPVNAAFVFDYNPKKSMKDRRKYILAQSKSLQQPISSGGQISWAPASCPPSPSS